MSNPLCFGVERGEIIKLDPSTNHPDSRALRQAVHQSRFTVGKVGDICEEIQDGLHGVRHYVEEGIPLLGVGNITEEGLDLGEVNRVTPKEHAKLRRSQVARGDALVTITGRLGTAMIYTSDDEANLSAHVARVRVKGEHNAGYLAAYLNSSIGRHFISLNEIGSTHPHINVNRLKDVTLVIPPRPTQDTIADKMEAAYRRKRELEAEAEALLESIDGYVLGELGIELPELEEDQYFVQSAALVRSGRLDPHYHLPKFRQLESAVSKSSYELCGLGEFVTDIKYGASVKNIYVRKGIPLLRITNLKPNEINFSEIVQLAPELEKTVGSAYVRKDDLLISRSGTIGVVAVVPQEAESFAYGSFMIRLRVKAELLDPQYVSCVCNSPIGRLHFQRSRIGAVQGNITIPSIKALRIPVPPLVRQRNIVAEAQRRRERAAALREEAARVLAEAKAEVERMILGEE